MKKITKIQFEKGEKVKLYEIMEGCSGRAEATTKVSKEMECDMSTATIAVNRFWEDCKKKQNETV